jgi:RimJ/RimL family protein N-acetyltransferase
MVNSDSLEAGPAAASAAGTATASVTGAEAEAGTVTVYEVPEQDWRIWRDLRLEALVDAPDAFGETLAQAQARDEENWRSWWSDPDAVGPRFIALVDGVPAAMCAIAFPEDLGGEPLLIAMWSSPKVRGRGAARAMLDACGEYCVRTDRPRLLLGVVEDNVPARTLYERYGFTATGGSDPLRRDPSKVLIWMQKPM